MGLPSDASRFLSSFAHFFENDVVREWKWDGSDDNDFGKAHSWDVVPFDPEAGQVVQANASVDLQLTQLTLSVSERQMDTGPSSNTDTRIVFEALIQFEDCRLTVGGVEREYSEEEIRAAILEFSERTR